MTSLWGLVVCFVLPFASTTETQTASPSPSPSPSSAPENSVVTPDGVMRISWEIDLDDNEIEFVVHASVGSGWAAIGVSDSPNMPDSSIIWGFLDSSGRVQVVEAYAKDRNRPRLITPSRIFDVESSRNGNVLNFEASRQLVTGTNSTVAIRPGNYQYLLWAHGTGTGSYAQLLPHSKKGIYRVDFGVGKADEVSSDLVKGHAGLMILSWAFLVPAGIFVARFLKVYDPLWFKFHRANQLLAVFFVIIAAAIAFNMDYDDDANGGEEVEEKFDNHGNVGIVVLFFAVVNPVIAAVRPHKGTRYRLHWFIVHSLVGYLVVFLSWYNIYSGMKLYGVQNSVFAAYWIILLFWLVSFTVAEIWTRLKRRSRATVTPVK